MAMRKITELKGRGVANAIQSTDGQVEFVLTDGSRTNPVALPRGRRGETGRDGSNVLPARTAIVADAIMPDFVDIAQQRSPYLRSELTLASDGSLTVACHADDPGEHSLSYLITPGTRYRLVSTIRESGVEHGVTYLPDPANWSGVHPGDHRLSDGTVTTTGTWNKDYSWYTTETGATFQAPITTTAPGAKVFMNFYMDNRGGMWKLDLAEQPDVTQNVSTFSGTGGAKYGIDVLTIPEPGTYTLRGTFQGADPDHAPSGGTARGWMVDPKGSLYSIRVSERSVGSVELSTGASNKNWAFQVRHSDVGDVEFFPYHGTDVETILDAEFYDGATRIDLDALSVGETVEVGAFSMVQHIQCHTSASPEELVDVWTTDTILPDGTYRADGTISVLHDLGATPAMYTGMLPFNPAELDLVVTSFRNAYPATPTTTSTGGTKLADEGLHSTSVAVVGPDPDLMAAVRFNSPEETRRMSRNANLGNTLYPPMFIEHRTPVFKKLYPRFGYLHDTLVPAGTVWRFSVDYWFGRIPGVRHIIE